ncbi:ABZJ_00895 family protein [Psychrobacter aestuarii]|uniref:DUF4199 domain-containing protein n=1 Tax=Psychrobacter aestuarii TaxID=556327 RepID=A0ABP3F829_9GAMM|nr:ABZJ_00895 family protein [Psychrobacter aestuarii]
MLTPNTPTPTTMTQAPSLRYYVGIFSIGYILVSTLCMLLQQYLPISLYMVMLLTIGIAAYIAVRKFVRQQRRALTRAEVLRLTVGAVVAVWLLSALYFLGLWFLIFDAANREVLQEAFAARPWALVQALMMMIGLCTLMTWIGLVSFNRLLAPK